MTARRRYALDCDGRGCQEWLQTDERSARSARRFARGLGWGHEDGADFCPICMGLPRHERACTVLRMPTSGAKASDPPPGDSRPLHFQRGVRKTALAWHPIPACGQKPGPSVRCTDDRERVTCRRCRRLLDVVARLGRPD